MHLEATFNYGEAVLWFALAVVVFLAGRRQPLAVRRNAWVAAGAFVAFGLSDVIEAQTGAWWRPWWLFVLKAVCVLVLAACLVRHRLLQRSGH